MKHLKSVNRKAGRIVEHVEGEDVVALQQGPPQQAPLAPHIPLGCTLVFSPGWEADQRGGTAGLCTPASRSNQPNPGRPKRGPPGRPRSLLNLSGVSSRAARTRSIWKAFWKSSNRRRPSRTRRPKALKST